jgi:hypothetical protein
LITREEIDLNGLQDSILNNFIKSSIEQNSERELTKKELQEEVKNSSLLASIGEQGFVRKHFEIMNDLNHQNVVEDALNFEKNELSFKMLFDFIYTQNKKKEVYDIFQRCMYLAFNDKTTFTDCLFKFINDNNEIKGNFYEALDLINTDLPKFSSEEHSLAEFDIHNIKNVVDPSITDLELIKQKKQEM